MKFGSFWGDGGKNDILLGNRSLHYRPRHSLSGTGNPPVRSGATTDGPN